MRYAEIRRGSGRRGFALLEVLIALVILSLAGVSATLYVAELLRQETELIAREAEMEEAERILGELWVMDQAALSRRLGIRQVGFYLTRVGRPEAGLFRISVASQARPGAELLVTVVYRPSPRRSSETLP